jgi:predicted TIM-barrel fold metal-dependent hydrolase
MAGMLVGRDRTLAVPKKAPAAPIEPVPIPIIDTHQHLWDLQRFRLPWNEPGSPLHRNFLMPDYLEATAGLQIVKAVYVEVMVEWRQQVQEAEYVLDLCRRGNTPVAGAVIAGDPASPGFRDYIGRFRGSPYLKGVRHSVRRALSKPLDPALARGMRLLGELGMSFDLLLGPAQLPAAAKLVDACPDTRFVLDHCGNVDVQAPDRSPWERDIAELARRPHVVCKVSGIVSSARPGQWGPADLEPIVKHVLKVFGPDRVVFGSDWPVCTLRATLRQWVEALKWIVRDATPVDQRKLFHDNATRIYGLR